MHKMIKKIEIRPADAMWGMHIMIWVDPEDQDVIELWRMGFEDELSIYMNIFVDYRRDFPYEASPEEQAEQIKAMPAPCCFFLWGNYKNDILPRVLEILESAETPPPFPMPTLQELPMWWTYSLWQKHLENPTMPSVLY